MIPIRDTIRSRSFPIINWLLIAANAVVFFFELSLSPAGLEWLVRTFGLVPGKIDLASPFTLIPFVTHIFLHGGWLHFLSNMWTLFIFGDNIEDRMGSVRFLVFYLAGGIAAGTLQTVVDPASMIPAIGASGAIAAVLGAYFLYFPKAQVITLIPLFFLPWFVNIPAVIYLGFWFVIQLYSGVMSLASAGGMAMGGVAWWAHIGGFLFGLVLAIPFAIRRRRSSRTYADEYYPF
jgi:membrane associated rhomboid family serine protease